jgi:hypothetical protein
MLPRAEHKKSKALVKPDYENRSEEAMKTKLVVSTFFTLMLMLIITQSSHSYPPAVGLLSKSKNCVTCHVNNGPWRDDPKTIIDVLDKASGRSLKQKDGTFLIEAKRGQPVTVLTVIGRTKDDTGPAPYRNGWIYIDPSRIESESLSKFAPGWTVNVPASCRVIGDTLVGYEGAKITVLPMTVRPLEDAQDGTLQLQAMITRGESVKNDPTAGMIGSYFERTVRLKVID